jgi:hypothetical protein
MNMNKPPGLDQCLAFISCQMQPPGRPAVSRNGERRRAVAISRQAGAGGHLVAEALRAFLDARSSGDCCPWTIFDRNLVEKVLEDHHLPKRLARFMPEDRISALEDMMDELFGLHPPSWTLVRKSAETILHLAELGNVILIGRGAHVVTINLRHVFRVRLVGSLERRVRRMREVRGLAEKEALELVRREDQGRERYLRNYFQKDGNDPLLYHLVLNTDLMPLEEAARIIGQAVIEGAYTQAAAERPAPA